MRCKNGEMGDDYSYGWISITKNCAEVFRTLRFVDKPRLVWIDAISIDQDDTDDRIHFVRQMHQIHRLASRVIVVLPNFKTVSGDLWVQSTPGPWIFSHPYFTRIWILQEVFYGQNPVIYAGDHKLDWLELCCLYRDGLEEDNFLDAETRTSVELVLATGQHDSQLASGDRKERTLEALFRMSKAFKATDERDKIIALTSMADDISPAQEAILVDYNTTYPIIFRIFVALCCLHKLHITWLIERGISSSDSDGYGALPLCKEKIDEFMGRSESRRVTINHFLGLPGTVDDLETGNIQAQEATSLRPKSFTRQISHSISTKITSSILIVKITALAMYLFFQPELEYLFTAGIIFLFILPYGLYKLCSLIWRTINNKRSSTVGNSTARPRRDATKASRT
jgi:hypothetical protein